MLDSVYNITLITDDQKTQMLDDTKVCIEMTQECQRAPSNGTICADAVDICFENLMVSESKRNPYDIREVCDSVTTGFCSGMDSVREFFNMESVREYLNVSDGPISTWVEASEEAGSRFEGTSGDYAKNYEGYVANLLDAGIRILIYTGDADFMCNWQGNEAWTSALQWSGKAGFNKAEQRLLTTIDPLDSRACRLTPNWFAPSKTLPRFASSTPVTWCQRTNLPRRST